MQLMHEEFGGYEFYALIDGMPHTLPAIAGVLQGRLLLALRRWLHHG
jgi:hypothetical protein